MADAIFYKLHDEYKALYLDRLKGAYTSRFPFLYMHV